MRQASEGDGKASNRRRRLLKQCLAAIPMMAGLGVGAQTRLQNSLAMLVPYPAGGGVDALARQIAVLLEDRAELLVNVENAAGGSGLIAANRLLNTSRPDATVMIGPPSLQTYVRETRAEGLPFNPDSDLRTLAVVALQKYLLVAAPEFDARSFLTGRSVPVEPVRYGVTGIGGASFFLAQKIQKTIGKPFDIIPYKGMSEIRQAFLSGQIHMAMVDEITGSQLVSARKAQAVMALSNEPCILFPDLPLARSFGLGRINQDFWIGVYASARISDAKAHYLGSRFDVLRGSSAFDEGLRKLGMQALVLTGAAAQRYDSSEQQRVRAFIAENR